MGRFTCFIHSYIPSVFHSIHSFIPKFLPCFFHLYIHSFSHSFTHSFILTSFFPSFYLFIILSYPPSLFPSYIHTFTCRGFPRLLSWLIVAKYQTEIKIGWISLLRLSFEDVLIKKSGLSIVSCLSFLFLFGVWGLNCNVQYFFFYSCFSCLCWIWIRFWI